MCGLALTGLWSSYKRIVVQVNPEGPLNNPVE